MKVHSANLGGHTLSIRLRSVICGESRLRRLWTHGLRKFSLVLAADFSLRSGVYHRKPWKYLGRGFVDDVILRPLVEKTESEKKNSAVIWAVHFPPRFRALSRFLALEGEDLLIDAAVRAGIKYVVAGHTHICDRYFGRTKQSGNCVTVICSGSPTAQGTEAPSFFDLEIVVHDNTIADIRPAIVGLKEFIHQRTQKRVRRFTL